MNILEAKDNNMGFHYKKNIGKGYQMKHGNSAFKMVTPTALDNAGLFYKLKEGIPNALNMSSNLLGGFGFGQILKAGAKKVTQIGVRKAAPIIAREVAKKVGQKGASQGSQIIQQVINPYSS